MSLIEKIALKPCPFCGGEAEEWLQHLDERFGYGGKAIIFCKSCRSQTGEFYSDDPPRGSYANPATALPKAITAWNNRAALTAIMGEGDGVQQCDIALWEKYGPAIFHADMTGPQALSEVRSTVAAAERARIVAWLRANYPPDHYEGWPIDLAADAIERGEV